MYLISALSEPPHSPFPALGQWCDSVRPDISGAVPIEAIQLHIFLALPKTTPCQVHSPVSLPLRARSCTSWLLTLTT